MSVTNSYSTATDAVTADVRDDAEDDDIWDVQQR